jgi:hypothetical protein
MNATNPISGVINWTFLNEPVWRWFIFMGALLLMNVAWADILDFIK